MYAVYIQEGPNANQEIIHSSAADQIKLFDPKILKAVDAIDSFTFSIYPNHQAYDKLNYLTTLIEVWNEETNRLLFKGRVLEPTESMNESGELIKDILCEGELAYLRDSIQKWNKWQNMTPAQFFRALIDEHNNQVESYKKFLIGNINVTNSTDNVYRYTEDDVDTYDTITEKLINRLGGELQIRYENGVRYLDYLQETGSKGQQKIELAVNLRAVSRKIDPTEMITVLKPLGERLEREDENVDASNPRLTIASVNNGDPYLRDDAKIAQFGIRVGAVVWDDVSVASNLKTKGLEFLKNQKTAMNQYQVDAVDLAPLDLSVENFMCGWRYQTYNPLMGIDEELRVVGMNINLNDPTASTLSIGDKILSQEQFNNELKQQVHVVQQLRSNFSQQSRRIVTIQASLMETEQSLVDMQNTISASEGEIQNQISAIIDELHLIVEEIQKIENAFPNPEVLINFDRFIEEQKVTNQELEERINQLESQSS